MDFSQIQQRWPQMEVVYREEVESTNDLAMQMAREEGGDGGDSGSEGVEQGRQRLVLVITDQQTAGRGRRGNEWSSRGGG